MRIAGLIVLSAWTAHAQNLVSNGTFESGNLNGWSAGSGMTASTAFAHGGSWSARSANGDMNTTFTTTVGTVYKFTGWIKIVSESGSDWGGFRCEIEDVNFATVAHSGYLYLADRGTNWFKLAMTFTAVSTTTRLYVGYFGGPGRTQMVHADDLSVVVKPANNTPPSITPTLTPTSFSSLPGTQTFGISGDDPDGAIARVVWDFGDGARVISKPYAPNATRRVGVPGSYTATVRVSDDDGAVTTQTISWSATSSGWPTISITTPSSDTTVTTSSTTVSGSASGTSISVFVSTDRGFSGAAAGTTSWSLNVPLQPGQNRVTAQVKDSSGNVVIAERKIRFSPSPALAVANVTENSTTIQRWDVLEATFDVQNSAATHWQFPYDTNQAPGLSWIEGISVDGLFSPDNWTTTYRRPAFVYQKYSHAQKDGEEWLYPSGTNGAWTVRFGPPSTGSWKYKIEVLEAKGTVQSAERTFTVTTPTNPNNHGPLSVAAADKRYFENADGTLYLGNGHGIGASSDSYSYDMNSKFTSIGSGNQQFFRFWIPGHIWGSAWQPWSSRQLPYDGNVPATGLSLDSGFGDGLAALKLDVNNQIMWQGFGSGHAPIVPGSQYKLRIRWRTDNVTGPAGSGPYGICVRWVGFPEIGQTAGLPLVIPHEHGDTPWHVAEAAFTASGSAVQNTDYIANPGIILENTTGGTAYVDEIGLYEVLTGGALGPQLLRSPRFNSHTTFDPRRGAGLDDILTNAMARNFSFKLNITEKQDWILNRLAPDGLPDAIGGNIMGGTNTPIRRLHQYYWRHMFARFGAYRSVHSWELCNEHDPNDMSAFRVAADLSAKAQTDSDPHMGTTSTWSGLASNSWNSVDCTAIHYNDFHCYVRGTGWLPNKEELANDSAKFFRSYDQEARNAFTGTFTKPVVWGEMGIDGTSGTNGEDPGIASDNSGVWLHKIVWARTGPGSVYPLYWYTDNIFNKSLHGLYGNWNRFMNGAVWNSGGYVNAAGATNNNALRCYGQKNTATGLAHLWIDNTNRTWKAVVNGQSIPAVTGTVTVNMGTANAGYTATWFNTATGGTNSTQSITADGSGNVVLNITSLTNDTAVKLVRNASDTTAPAAVANLAVSGTTSSSATLTWTAPGDDGNSGTATSYDIRYSTSLITSANWASATLASGEPAPLVAGSAQSFTVNGLSANTTYYFALKTSDEVGNVSPLSNVPSGATQPPPDTTAPAAVANLAVSGTTSSSATLTWTAPGDDGNTGTATSYDIRYSTSLITSANWASATQASGEPAPLVAGSAQSFTVNGLSASTTYYFAIETSDEVGNLSPLSNVPSGTTAPPPDTTAPATVANLAVSGTTSSSATLTWTAPGDDGNSGTATSYDIRYSTSLITSANWASATQASGEPAPLVAGSAQSFTVNGLSASTTYYFAIETSDEVGNISPLSNVPSGTTQGSGLPSPWANGDIGAVGAAGSASYSSGTFTVIGSGADIWGNADEFQFVRQTLNGDGTIIARVASVQNTDPWAKAGVMMRETLNADSRHCMVVVSAGNGVAFQRRVATGGVSTHTAGPLVAAPYWVKLVRSGNIFTASSSSNGTSWATVGTETNAMAGSIYVGLAVTSHADGTLCTATFDNVSLTIPAIGISFSGATNSYGAVNDAAVLDITGSAVTLEAFVKVIALPASGKLGVVMARELGGSSGYALLIGDNGRIEVRLGTSGNSWGQLDTGALTWNGGQWYHVAASYDGTTLRAFRDGVQQGSVAQSGTLIAGANKLYFGGYRYDWNPTDFLNAVIDEGRLSKVARYTTNFSPPTAPFSNDSNTVGLWHFDENSGATSSDASGNGLTVNLNNATWTGGKF